MLRSESLISGITGQQNTLQLTPAAVRRLRAKPDTIIVDIHAASPSSWNTPCMAARMAS